MNIYQKHGNIQLLGNIKVNDISLSIDEFKQLIVDNVQWKRYITYSQGQICSKKVIENDTTITSFYYSTSSNNLNHNPLDNDINYWKPISFQQQNSNNLLFKIPKFPQNEQYSFGIQFSVNESFTSSLYYLTLSNSIGNHIFYLTDGEGFAELNKTLLSNADSDNILLLKTDDIASNYNYFRYYWMKNGIHTDEKYYFGTRNSNLQTFDNSAEVVSFTVNNQNISGDGSILSPFALKKNLTIDSISTNNDFSINTTSADIIINSNSGGNQLLINACNIKYNNNDENTANGIVVLNQNGKIPHELYNDYYERLLPIKTLVDIQNYGNPLVIYSEDTLSDYEIQNSDSTLLLIQGNSKNNQAIGLDENIQYDDYITISNDWFQGGMILRSNSNAFGNLFQFAIQIDKNDLSNVYYTLFQHFISDNQTLCCLKINRNNIYFGLENNFSHYNINGLQDIIKIVVRYNSNNVKIYLNSILAIQFDFNSTISPFSNTDFVFYIGNQITQYSNEELNLLGYPYKWRLLKIDNALKDKQVDKNIGQLYSDTLNDNPSNHIKVDYNWNFSEDVQGAYIFGKKDNKPYIFRFPNIGQYTLPKATRSRLGGVIIGGGLYIDQNGVLSASNGEGNSDLSYYIQRSNDININGDINIRSKAIQASSVTIQSSYIENGNYGGKLFLGNNIDKQISLSWIDKKIGFYVFADNLSNPIVSLSNCSDSSESSESNSTRIDLNYEGSVNIYSSNEKLTFNGAELNHPNGLVKLNSLGKINSDLIEYSSEGSLSGSTLRIYDSNNIVSDHSGIKAGNNISITYQGINNEIAVINANEQGVFKQDRLISSSDLTNGKYFVEYEKLGGFVVQDDQGYLIHPAQRYYENRNGRNGVQIDLSEWTIPSGSSFKIRYVRGYKGDNGQITQDQALNMILFYLY